MPKFDEDQVRHFELMAKAMEKGASFNSLFIAAGYVTFFALWKNVGGCATPTSHMLAGASITLSAVLYVLWMVFGLVVLNIAMMSLVNQVESSPRLLESPEPLDLKSASAILREALDDKDSGMTHVQRASYRMLLSTLKVAKLWPYALAAIMLPALLGMGIVFSTYVHGAWLSYHGDAVQCASQLALSTTP
ncbi:hypothetical protein [Lysobacter sp. CA199]|uniref:hypothetical protein n=1 Tax=Lysobacter sp. CA199 TaxID=3455608 RepID=UPI003F8D6ACB